MTNFSKEKINNKNRRTAINAKIINKVLFILVIALAILYIATANDLTIKGFELQSVKKELSKKREENKKFELQMMNLASNNKLSERVKKISMVPDGEIDYISSADSLVVKK